MSDPGVGNGLRWNWRSEKRQQWRIRCGAFASVLVTGLLLSCSSHQYAITIRNTEVSSIRVEVYSEDQYFGRGTSSEFDLAGGGATVLDRRSTPEDYLQIVKAYRERQLIFCRANVVRCAQDINLVVEISDGQITCGR